MAASPIGALEESLTMRKTVLILGMWIVGLFAEPAHAIWMRSQSIEWLVNVSDVVAVAEVSRTEKIEPLNKYFESHLIECKVTSTLKGKRIDAFTFRQDYRLIGRDDALLRPANKLLLFFGTEPEDKRNSFFWVNISKPDSKLSLHAPYNNNCEWLEDGEKVVALVKNRIAGEIGDRVKKRGVIVPFTVDYGGSMYWDFVRTADPDYKLELRKQLREGDAESAIYNLVSYPGNETIELIRPFLKDPKTAEMHVHDGRDAAGRDIKTIKIYPVRQAAYAALQLLGETPEQPEGFHRRALPWLFMVGFEERAHFPHGDWKRIKNTARLGSDGGSIVEED